MAIVLGLTDRSRLWVREGVTNDLDVVIGITVELLRCVTTCVISIVGNNEAGMRPLTSTWIPASKQSGSLMAFFLALLICTGF